MIYNKTMFPDTYFPLKVSWKWWPFCFFCPGNSQNWKKKKNEKITIFTKFMEKEIKKVGNPRIPSYEQKIKFSEKNKQENLRLENRYQICWMRIKSA